MVIFLVMHDDLGGGYNIYGACIYRNAAEALLKEVSANNTERHRTFYIKEVLLSDTV
jgi:hypothetical protein